MQEIFKRSQSRIGFRFSVIFSSASEMQILYNFKNIKDGTYLKFEISIKYILNLKFKFYYYYWGNLLPL